VPVLPPAFLFRYALPVRRLADAGPDAVAAELPGEYRLPQPALLSGGGAFAVVKLGWNNAGLAVGVEVSGKTQRPHRDPLRSADSDGLQVWIDTRDTQSIHRASRFCHHFCLLPTSPAHSRPEPIAVQLPIARAREDVSLADPDAIPVHCDLLDDGYRLRAWIPAEVLHGYDPESTPRLGFYYSVRDAELGVQTLTVDDDFPYTHDPSLWSTLELVDAS
jgi:hypothetical protein